MTRMFVGGSAKTSVTAANRFHPKTRVVARPSGFVLVPSLVNLFSRQSSLHPSTHSEFIMVLVDFTLAERWRVFGELSFAPIPYDAKRQTAVTATPAVLARAAFRYRPARRPPSAGRKRH